MAVTTEPKHFGLLINGEWLDRRDGKLLEVRSPNNGQVFATLPEATQDELDAAIEAAQRAFDKQELSPNQRYEILYKASQLLTERVEDIAFHMSMEGGKPVPDRGSVYLEGGFEPGRIYEVVYVSENPSLVGLGPAAVRDAVSRLKYEGSEPLGITVDAIDRAIAFGISQSGRFLRTFLYYGFNQDEQGRMAFDGIMSHVAGAGRHAA